MVGSFRPADVADAFVKQYYHILQNSPEIVHKFYQDESIQGWPGFDGVVTPATTLRGINNKVMSSDFKHCTAQIKSTDAQESVDGGIIVAVTGCLVGKDDETKNFYQTFFLAKQDRGFYVLNDILRVFDACKTTPTGTAPSTDGENGQPAPTEISVPCSTSDSPSPSKTEAPIENGKVEEVVAMSASDDTNANDASHAPSLATDADAPSVVEPAKETKVPSVVESAKETKAPSVVEPAKETKAPSVVEPAKEAKAPSVVEPVKKTKAPSVVEPVKKTKAPSVVEPVKKTKAPTVVEPVKKTKAPSVVEPAENTKAPSVAVPAANAKMPSVFTPASNVTPKITYASMLARETPVASPKATSNVIKQKSASPTAKASAPLADGASKVSTPSSGVSKPLVSSTKVAPKSPAGGLISGANAEVRGIYIGGLPYKITKQGIVDVVKQFGPVKRYSDTVQIIRHEDGFCCGFVEFESADSARRAVEVHHVIFGNKTAYVTYKRTSSNRGFNGRERSPTRGGNRNGGFRGARRSSSSDGWSKLHGRSK